MWKFNSFSCENGHKIYQYQYQNTNLYIVIAEKQIHNGHKHFQLFLEGVNYYLKNPSAEIYRNFQRCKEFYGFSETPFYQGFYYAKHCGIANSLN